MTGGQKLLEEVSDVILRRGHYLSELRLINVYLARERARRGDRDEAIPLMRAAVDHLFARDNCCRGALLRRVFWWRHCSTAGPRVTWPKPKPRSSG